jgi:hypothetical protein
MAEFKLDRFKYNWRGDWEAATDYKRDDIVRVNGKSYVCIITHTSDSIFRNDLNAVLPNSSPPQPQPRWAVMTSGRTFVGNWESGSNYNVGDIILYNGSLWLAIESHTASAFSSDIQYWTTFALNMSFVGEYSSGTVYGPGAIVKYNGNLYKANTSVSAAARIEDQIDSWDIFHVGIEYRGEYLNGETYRLNDIVKYGPTVFRCTETFTASTDNLDITKFDVEFPGIRNAGTWIDNVDYKQGDIVKYGGFLYYAIENSFDVEPSREPNDSTVTWTILAKTSNFVGDFNPGTPYKTGDIVQRGGWLYQAVRDVNLVTGTDSTVDYLDTDIWEVIAPGKRWANSWDLGNKYSVGDVVYHLGTAYVCNFEHDSESFNRPGDNGEGYEFWDILIQAGQPGGLHDKGDLLSYGLTREFTGDGSSEGDYRVPIGEESDVLSVNTEYEVFWRKRLNDSDTVYVGTNGSNDPGYGLSEDKPFRTIRHACEYIEDNIPAGSPAKVFVATGRYEEIGPIIIPAGTVVMGDELRATVVAANPVIDHFNDNIDFVSQYRSHITSFISALLSNQKIITTPGNTEPQVLQGSISNNTVANRIVSLMQDYQTYIDFRLADGDADATESGSNQLNLDDDGVYQTGYAQLRANNEFIAQEVLAYIIDENPGRTIDRDLVLEDVRTLVRGLAEDIKYSGNHRTLFAARRFTNGGSGSANDNIFFMRDITGLRNMTTEGLIGSLNPPGVYDLYQRPTGGALVSFDPGWGPDDDRVWIKNRSPYIQGVTNIGQGCVGCKIDGSLHNGGLKSMVTNDFTQVLSDGIGVWVSNNARAELVSMFTYYCTVGYLADNGGVIRATNGNNSYGDFGSIADGNDPNEIPQNVTVNNRTQEAEVYQGFAGGNDDRILLFEYSNAGTHYTQADATIIGAGQDADVEFTDFRAGGLFNARLINTKGSGSEGGSEYLIRQGYAQVTSPSTSTIKLSSTDVTQFESEILGMMITIISGDGVGQYGVIDGYDPVTKTVDVVKKSDGSAGWDHVVAGSPINTTLDSTAYYRIEPNIVCNSPGFDSGTSYPLSIELNWVDMVYGGTSALYNNLTGGNGTAPTFDVLSFPATFRVNREGDTYTVTVINPGAGYAVGDTLTILGSEVGGVSPDNDITITVTESSEDSTNSIQSISYEGTPRSGRFVAISQDSKFSWSDNGQVWAFGDLPFTGTYVKILAADNKFIALVENDNKYAFSYNGTDWTTRSLPDTQTWSDIAYGNGKFVITSTASDVFLYSSDGLTFTAGAMPTTAGGFERVAYGQGTFVAISGGASGAQNSATSTDGINWTLNASSLTSTNNWVSFVYGANRFLAVAADGYTMYSVDKGQTWYGGQNLTLGTDITSVKYHDGIFFAIAGGTGVTDECATSEDGILWNPYTHANSLGWSALAFAVLNDVGTWVAIANSVLTNGVNFITTGATAKVRGVINQGSFDEILIWDPGSGYSSSNPVTFTVTDNQFITEVEIDGRIGTGVIAQPDFNNRGAGYRTTSSIITITGNGYADFIPQANILTLSGVEVVPGPGVQIRITGILDETTDDPDDLKLFNGVTITDKGDDGSGNGTRIVEMQISPRLRNEYNLEHGTGVELRSQYSQCRITGHDFLDIGTGNFEQTNYPDLYAGGNYFVAAPENEVLEANGGRVFYTSTDQDGNFRTGELFAVNQATGVVTISAEFFDLDGLSELALGGVRLGGSGAVVREFSTDPTFAEDSNNVVPTQRAIATFLADRLSVGGENLETNGIQAGLIIVGTEENKIETVDDSYLYLPSQTIWNGTYDSVDARGVVTTRDTAVSGTMISQMLFLRLPDDTMQ